MMNDKWDLYDARVGVETYARIISESIKEQETWRDMVLGAVALCLEFQDGPACGDNPYLCNLLMNAVICVLIESKDFFGDSDHVRELELVRSTKRAIAEVISDIQDEVDDCYPEGAESG
jgi:hypothetical protein